MNIESLSLDQLRVLLTIVEEGSFGAAARRLRRAQSAVSYSISTLESQLDVELFDRSGYRPVLTAAGKTLLGEIREIIARTDRLKTHARAMSAGLEAEVSVVSDLVFPLAPLCSIFYEFNRQFPGVSLRIYSDSLGGVADLVLNGTCSLGILATLPEVPAGLIGHALSPIDTQVVAAPGHPLAQVDGRISTHSLRDHPQIVLSDRSNFTSGRDFNVFSSNSWRVSDIQMKLQLIRSGVGWGSLPANLTHPHIDEGSLVALQLEALPVAGEALAAFVVQRVGSELGPATSWLLEHIRGH